MLSKKKPSIRLLLSCFILLTLIVACLAYQLIENPLYSKNKTIYSNKIFAGYLPNWNANTIRLTDVDKQYNLIYLFSATPIKNSQGQTGAVYYDFPGNLRHAADNLISDIKYVRRFQGRKIILSIGGARNGMEFTNRAKSKAFVDSISSIYNSLGGIDGIDLNTFEGKINTNTEEMIWIGLELKRRYPNFIITAPPAPWNKRDLDLCEAMVKAGAMDYAAPQYYDGPNLSKPSYVIKNIKQWVEKLGERHVVLGLGVQKRENYMTPEEALETWTKIQATYPNIRGIFNWQIMEDEKNSWVFAKTLGNIVNN